MQSMPGRLDAAVPSAAAFAPGPSLHLSLVCLGFGRPVPCVCVYVRAVHRLVQAAYASSGASKGSGACGAMACTSRRQGCLSPHAAHTHTHHVSFFCM